MARRNKQSRPWRQADLDNLCGVVSTINCLRYCLGSRQFGYERSTELFSAIAHRLWEVGRLHKTIDDGMSDRDWSMVLTLAVRYVSQRFGQRVRIARPFRRGPRPALQQFLRAVRDFLREPGRAVLIGYETLGYEHFTVIRGLSDTAVLLYDSIGLNRFPISSCTTGKAIPSCRRRYVIEVQTAVFVSAQ